VKILPSGHIAAARDATLAVAILVFAGTQQAQAQKDALVVGRPSPRFELEKLTGGRLTLSEFRGRPIVINFWASWCKPCRTEMPDLIRAWRANAGALEVLAVNLTDQENRADVTRFVDELALPFPVLLDVRGKVRELYALVLLPTTVFVDSAGLVRTVHSGPLTATALELGLGTILPHLTAIQSAPAKSSDPRDARIPE
jgi:thiol-disulfide isomerase/thioredoxin